MSVGQATVLDLSWPADVAEIAYRSSGDNTDQPALFYTPKAARPAPLLVGLHTWSNDHRHPSGVPYAEWCIAHGWTFVYPNFRGPNNRPQSTGSELVVGDIVSAVAYARETVDVDPARIYLVGASGGGYGALLMAGRAPDIWAGVSAWVPIVDLAAWYREALERDKHYAQEVAAACGGVPGESDAVDQQYRLRSAITHLGRAAAPLDINAGIRDGHTGSVPVHHALWAFNCLAAPRDRLSEDEIAYFVREADVPLHLRDSWPDAAYGAKRPLFRRQSGRVRVTIFDGGHEIIHGAALGWLMDQRKD